MANRMAPRSSPGGTGTGIRRVNNMPLFITGAAIAGFIVIMAMVAVERGRNKAVSADQKPKGNNASLFADSITSKFQGGFIPAKASPPVVAVTKPEDKQPGDKPQEKPPEGKPLVVPIAHVNLDRPPAPPNPAQAPSEKDQELARIRQIKTAAFEDAVKSPTSGQTVEFKGRGGLSDPPPLATDATGDRAAPKPSALAGKVDRWHLASRPEPPETRYVLRTGFVIPAVMISGINSQLPGPVIAQVSQPVYDTATGQHLLVPQGTRLFGAYGNEVAYGQERVFVAWQRLIFPDGKAMDLGEMPGTDGAGLSGLTGDVNNHYVRIFGNALLMSLITAAATYSQQPSNTSSPVATGYQQTASGALSSALGQQLGTAGTALLMKNLNIAPTIDVHAGYRLNVVATKDLTFDKPYQPFSK